MMAAPQLTAMVVEDDPTVLGVVTDYLASAGYRVTAFADGASGRRALADRLPDVLILDRMLPGVSGDELCRVARERDDRLPILMLTALDRVDDRIEGLEHGADDYLAKPFSLRELLLRVNAMLRRVRARCRRQPSRSGRSGSTPCDGWSGRPAASCC